MTLRQTTTFLRRGRVNVAECVDVVFLDSDSGFDANPFDEPFFANTPIAIMCPQIDGAS